VFVLEDLVSNSYYFCAGTCQGWQRWKSCSKSDWITGM